MQEAIRSVLKPHLRVRPPNGQETRFHSSKAIATLEISTRVEGEGRADYFLKLVDHLSGAVVLTIYVRGGQSTRVEVPLGSYQLRYAVVRDWYGPHRFGPYAGFSRADETFVFRQDVQRDAATVRTSTTVIRVELWTRIGGNLKTSSIAPESF